MGNIDFDDYLDFGVRPRRLAEKEADLESIRKARRKVGISVEVSEKLSPGAEGLLADVVDDLAGLSLAVSRGLSRLMVVDGLPQRIIGAVGSREKLSRPKIRVLGWPEFRDFEQGHEVEQLDQDDSSSEPMSDESFFVIFNLPVTLAHWWWKGVGDWGNLGIDIGGSAIEWGRYYREISHTVWDFFDSDGPWKKAGRSHFYDRYSAVGSHKPGEYYYIYVVGRPVWWWYKDVPDLEYNPGQIQAAFRKALEGK